MACLGEWGSDGMWQARWNTLGHLSQQSSSPPPRHTAHQCSLGEALRQSPPRVSPPHTASSLRPPGPPGLLRGRGRWLRPVLPGGVVEPHGPAAPMLARVRSAVLSGRLVLWVRCNCCFVDWRWTANCGWGDRTRGIEGTLIWVKVYISLIAVYISLIAAPWQKA